jgi:hypothetical protein
MGVEALTWRRGRIPAGEINKRCQWEGKVQAGVRCIAGQVSSGTAKRSVEDTLRKLQGGQILVLSNPYADLRSKLYERLVAAVDNICQLIVEVEKPMVQLPLFNH